MAFERLKKEKTKWEKARPYVLGIGIPAVIILALAIGLTIAFKPTQEEDIQDTSTPTGWIVTPSTGENKQAPKPKPVTTQTPTYSTNSANTNANETLSIPPETASISSSATDTVKSDSVISVIDTAATRKLQEKKLQEEIDKMRQQYHNNRVALLNEAVNFLHGNHSQRAVKAKASNFKKLGDDLLKKIDEFPQPSSDAEEKLWDAQKEELRKTASFLKDIATKVSATNGETRKMRMTANLLQSEGAP